MVDRHLCDEGLVQQIARRRNHDDGPDQSFSDQARKQRIRLECEWRPPDRARVTTINYNVTSDYDELAFQLPNLYNDQPDFLHTIDVTYTPPSGGTPLEAFRLVKAKPVVVIKDNIVTPPEVDSDGKALRHQSSGRR